MATSIGRSTYGTLDRLLASVGTLQDQRVTLQQQTVTGKVAQSYAGLGASSALVLDLSATSSRADAFTQAIAQAQGKASVMQDTLSRIEAVVSDVAAKTLTLIGSSPTGAVEGVAQQARSAFVQIASLLNTSYAGDYVFAGADTANAPVPSPTTVTASGMFVQIRAEVANLATVPTAPSVGDIITDTVNIARDTNPGTTIFSSYLSSAAVATADPVTVQIGETERVSLQLLANRNTIQAPGTESAINGILRSLAVVANSTGAMTGNPDFSKLMQNAAETLTSAGTTLTIERGRIGVTQNVMTAAAEGHASMKVILSTQLSSLADVDMATTISRLQAVRGQLEASYNVLSITRSLNLASYL